MAVIKIVPMPGIPGPTGATPSLLVTQTDHSADALETSVYLTDVDKFFIVNNSNNQTTITVPLNATTAIPVGAVIRIVVKNSTIFINKENNATMNIWADSNTTEGEWYTPSNTSGLYTLLKIGTNDWILSGPDLSRD